MWWALPTSDYYESSVAMRNIQTYVIAGRIRRFRLGNPQLTILIGMLDVGQHFGFQVHDLVTVSRLC